MFSVEQSNPYFSSPLSFPGTSSSRIECNSSVNAISAVTRAHWQRMFTSMILYFFFVSVKVRPTNADLLDQDVPATVNQSCCPIYCSITLNN